MEGTNSFSVSVICILSKFLLLFCYNIAECVQRSNWCELRPLKELAEDVALDDCGISVD
jgi:hypothetical protein